MPTATMQDYVQEGVNSKQGLSWGSRFSPTEDPYETIDFQLDDVVLKNAATGIAFHEDLEVLFPKSWSRNAREITSQHYLRGPLGSEEREKSVPQMIDRGVDTVTRWAMEGRPEVGRLLPGGQPLFDSWESAQAFAADLKYLIITQRVNFNSPFWYNIGVEGVAQQPSACFILEVIDEMSSILNWYVEEGIVFKGGSGAGTNLSNIRSSFEGLRKGGWASGPVSYMCGADSSAGTMKSGGRSRRAAKMVVLNIDHPDIFEQATGAPGFIPAKARAEDVNQVLKDNGFDMAVDSGKDAIHVQFQNANNSVRVTNEFMGCVLEDGEWLTVARQPELVRKPVPKYQAKFLWREIAKAAWRCADPGLQMDTTVNFWHTTPAAGRINASNPCSEYMSLDNSPCNLAATNLLKFVREDGSWDVDEYTAAVEVVAIAQTILAVFGDYPTEKILEVATGFRQIGQGYTNLGAMLMTKGLAYSSADGRAWAAGITSLMEGTLYAVSGKIAARWGAYPGNGEEQPGFDHPENRKAQLKVANLRREYTKAIADRPSAKGKKLSLQFGGERHIDTFHQEVLEEGASVKADTRLKALVRAARWMWDQAIELGNQFGWAHSHMSVLAPMGTNGYMMDHDTSGIEPALSLKIDKKKVSGDWMKIVNQSVRGALQQLGYDEEQQEEILTYVDSNNSVAEAPHLRAEHYPVFDTSFQEPVGGRYLSSQAHVLMMAAVQPFISGAISKTVNLPETITVEEIEQIYFDSWRLGLKAISIYRDNCKATQPMSAEGKTALAGPPPTRRHKLPRKTKGGGRIKLRIVDLEMGEFELYALYSCYPDGSFGEIFEIAGAEGSFVNGLLAWGAKMISLSVQHGTPLKAALKLGLNMKFPPSAKLIPPDDSDFTSCTSIVDLLCRELALEFLTAEERHELGIFTRSERAEDVAVSYQGAVPSDPQALLDLIGLTPAEFFDALESGKPIKALTAGAGGAEVVEVTPPPKKLQAPFVLHSAPMCFQCSIPMLPRGTCFACPQCGNTTGCS